MGSCCSSTATTPSSPPPLVAQTTAPPPVPSQSSTERPSLAVPLSRTRGETASKPGLTHNRLSSQDSNSRSRTKSAPHAPQSTKSSSLRNPRTRAQSVSGPKRSDHSDPRPTSLEQLSVVVPAPTKSTPSSSGSRTSPAAREQGKKSRITVPFRRSPALRPSRRDISIQTSIKAGQSGRWCRLWSRLDFVDQPLKNCVNILHVDIVNIWEQYDGDNYLSSDQFKIRMSHVVKDLALSASHVPSSINWNRSGDKFADWVYDAFRGSQENVRCLMGYIVDLHVILNEISKTAATSSNVTDVDALEVMNKHVRSDNKTSIHQEVRSFVTEKYPKRFSDPAKDLFMEKIVVLIGQYCPGEAGVDRAC